MIEGFEILPVKYETTCSTDNNALRSYTSDVTDCVQCTDSNGNICNKNSSGSCDDPCYPQGLQDEECTPKIMLLNFLKSKKESCDNFNNDVANYNNWHNTQYTDFINELNNYMVDYEGKIGNEFFIDPDSTRTDGIIINSTNCGTDACTGPDLCNSNLSGNNPDCANSKCDSLYINDPNSPLAAAADYNNYRWNELCVSEGCVKIGNSFQDINPLAYLTDDIGCNLCPNGNLSNQEKAQILRRDSVFYDLNDNQYQKKKYECRLNDAGIDNKKQQWADQNTTNPGHPNNQPPVREYSSETRPDLQICQNIAQISDISSSNISDLKQSCNISNETGGTGGTGGNDDSFLDIIIDFFKDLIS